VLFSSADAKWPPYVIDDVADDVRRVCTFANQDLLSLLLKTDDFNVFNVCTSSWWPWLLQVSRMHQALCVWSLVPKYTSTYVLSPSRQWAKLDNWNWTSYVLITIVGIVCIVGVFYQNRQRAAQNRDDWIYIYMYKDIDCLLRTTAWRVSEVKISDRSKQSVYTCIRNFVILWGGGRNNFTFLLWQHVPHV